MSATKRAAGDGEDERHEKRRREDRDEREKHDERRRGDERDRRQDDRHDRHHDRDRERDREREKERRHRGDDDRRDDRRDERDRHHDRDRERERERDRERGSKRERDEHDSSGKRGRDQVEHKREEKREDTRRGDKGAPPRLSKEEAAERGRLLMEQIAGGKVATLPTSGTVAADAVATGSAGGLNLAAMQASLNARMQELRNKVGPALTAAGSSSGAPPPAVPALKSAPLIMTSDGRVLDSTGKEVKLSHPTSELKVNARAKEKLPTMDGRKKKGPGGATQEPKPETVNPYLDPTSKAEGERTRRVLQFREEGYYQEMAERKRAKERLEALQAEIAAAAKKTGISSATKLALAVPRQEGDSDTRVPDVEWWDKEVFAPGCFTYDAALTESSIAESLQAITHLIQHPIPFEPPIDGNRTVVLPVRLTEKERKKIRLQRRREEEREMQEKIRLGLMEAPAPKVKIANLMRVLGTEAVQDPTKVEAVVRAQMALRQERHESANESRKLTPAQRQAKRVQKLKQDTKFEIQACLFRVNDLRDKRKCFKVEENAKQQLLTGVGLMHRDLAVVLVEGGARSLKKYKKLMLRRIRWQEEKDDDEASDNASGAEDGGNGDEPKRHNQCVLVWEGTVPERAFDKFEMKLCRSEAAAREVLQERGVPQYWDLAFSQAILENAED
jgi:U4/U6 small nuclear ribonucleoprotein PRP3